MTSRQGMLLEAIYHASMANTAATLSIAAGDQAIAVQLFNSSLESGKLAKAAFEKTNPITGGEPAKTV